MSVEIPLLPLGAVLFPHMPLALHIFEQRYRTMMRDCQQAGHGFGVVGIREGSEVGGSARPYLVGTLAQLQEVEELDDGRFELVVSGASRFLITEFSFDRPYLMGRVDYLEELSDREPPARLIERAQGLFRRYATALESILGRSLPEVEMVPDVERLSYLIASMLQLETRQKQRLLEIDDAGARLRQTMRLMRHELMFLDRQLARRDLRFASGTPN